MNDLCPVKIARLAAEMVTIFNEEEDYSQIELVAAFNSAGQIVSQTLIAHSVAINLHNMINNS
jgi:hypothetical protein